VEHVVSNDKVCYTDDMTPSEIGSRAEGAMLATLLKEGHAVLLPFGGHQRYDMVIDGEDGFQRVQVKHGRVRNGAVAFSTISSTGTGEKKVVRNYVDEVEFFGVYCSELDSSYLVPIQDTVSGICSLRIEPTKNKQAKGVKWAEDYVLG